MSALCRWAAVWRAELARTARQPALARSELTSDSTCAATPPLDGGFGLGLGDGFGLGSGDGFGLGSGDGFGEGFGDGLGAGFGDAVLVVLVPPRVVAFVRAGLDVEGVAVVDVAPDGVLVVAAAPDRVGPPARSDEPPHAVRARATTVARAPSRSVATSPGRARPAGSVTGLRTTGWRGPGTGVSSGAERGAGSAA